MPIHFYFQKYIKLTERKRLKFFINKIFKSEGYQLNDISIIFCDDKFLLKINIDYLNHNYFTDIITFNLTENKVLGIKGEIYISADRVKENCIAYKTFFYEELNRVIFHGILHLCGYSDNSVKEKKIMRLKENFYLDKYLRFT